MIYRASTRKGFYPSVPRESRSRHVGRNPRSGVCRFSACAYAGEQRLPGLDLQLSSLPGVYTYRGRLPTRKCHCAAFNRPSYLY